MPDQLVIEFVANTQALKDAKTVIDSITGADKELAAEFKKNGQDMNKELEKLLGSAGKLSGEVKKVGETVQWGAATKQANEFARSLNDATNKGVKLTTQLRAMRDELARMETAGLRGSKAFLDLSVKAAKLEDQIGDTARQVRILASDTKNIDAGIQVITGLAGAFSVAQGAAALLGDENEDLQKALLKVQATMAILNGLQAVSNTLNKDSAARVVLAAKAQGLYNVVVGASTGALKAFKIALAATGIGLIIIAIGALIANFDKIKTKVLELFPGIQNMGKAFDEVKAKVMGFLAAAIETVTKVAKIIFDFNTFQFKKGLEEIKTFGKDIANAYKEGVREELENQEDKKIQDALIKTIADRNKEILLSEAKSGKERLDLRKKQAEDNLELLKLQGKGETEEATKFEAEKLEIQRKANEEAAKLAAAPKAGSVAFFNELVTKAKTALENAAVGSDAYEKALDQLRNALQLAATAQIAFDKSLERPIDEIKALETGGVIEIPAPEETPEGISAIEVEDFKTKNQKEQQEVREKQEAEHQEKLADIQKQHAQEAFNVAVDFANQLFENSQRQIEFEITALEEKRDQGIISEKQFQTEVAKLKTKAANAEKKQAVFNVILQTAVAITRTLAEVPKFDFGISTGILVALYAALGAAQLATIIAQPVPKFAKGTEKVKGGKPGKDSVHAMLMPGERVVPTDINEKLAAIPNKELPKLAKLKGLMDEFPHLNFEMIEKMSEGKERFSFDYQMMAAEFGKELKKHPQHIWTFDRHGMSYAVKENGNYKKYLDDRYSA